MLGERAPAHREDVAGVVLAPVVKGAPPAIKHDKNFIPLHFSDGGGADEVRVLLVYGLQLHAWLKVVLRRPDGLLKRGEKLQCSCQKPSHMCFHTAHTFLKAVAGAISAPFKVLRRNIGHEEAFIRNPSRKRQNDDSRVILVPLCLPKVGWQAQILPPPALLPSGGCSMSPFFSQVPMGWISEESTSLQKSLLLSLPSSRRRRRTPVRPITVAMHTEVEFRGSWASSFIPTLKSLEGGILAYRGKKGLKPMFFNV